MPAGQASCDGPWWALHTSKRALPREMSFPVSPPLPLVQPFSVVVFPEVSVGLSIAHCGLKSSSGGRYSGGHEVLLWCGDCWWSGSSWIVSECALCLAEPSRTLAKQARRTVFKMVSLACLCTVREVFLRFLTNSRDTKWVCRPVCLIPICNETGIGALCR